MRPFPWRLRLRVPEGWSVVSNGVPAGKSEFASLPTIASADIAIVAAPALVRYRTRDVAVVVEAGRPSVVAEAVTARVGTSLAVLSSWYGAAAAELQVTVVCSDRAGFAYSRLPAIFLPTRGALSPATHHTVHHELAHLWWNVAPVSGIEDWLNEGLAEYSALRLTRRYDGDAAADAINALYHAAAASSREDPAVAATGLDAPNSFFVNKYARGALFFGELEHRLPEDRWLALLGRWHRRHAAAHDASTVSLLAAIAADDATLARQAEQVLSMPAWPGDWP